MEIVNPVYIAASVCLITVILGSIYAGYRGAKLSYEQFIHNKIHKYHDDKVDWTGYIIPLIFGGAIGAGVSVSLLIDCLNKAFGLCITEVK